MISFNLIHCPKFPSNITLGFKGVAKSYHGILQEVKKLEGATHLSWAGMWGLYFHYYFYYTQTNVKYTTNEYIKHYK